ncbi:MAG TPA: histidine phosphatase family protein [Amnibacterium sp.]
MVARALHLVRHGEVYNPAGVIYGRLPGYRLSDRGREMAATTARAIADLPVTRLVASPLLRTQQSAQPIAEIFDLEVEPDERVIESANRFEGRVSAGAALFSDPKDWPLFRNPLVPTWGEPYRAIVERMRQVILEVFATTESGDAVIVTHQLPIWMTHRSVQGKPLPHDPRNRRCALSSVTTFERHGGRIVETAYADPAASVAAVDRGAT